MIQMVVIFTAMTSKHLEPRRIVNDSRRDEQAQSERCRCDGVGDKRCFSPCMGDFLNSPLSGNGAIRHLTYHRARLTDGACHYHDHFVRIKTE